MSTEFSFEKAVMTTNEHGVWLCIKLPIACRQAVRDFVLNIKEGAKYIAELRQSKAKRSLDQNGYYWVLCGQLSAVLRMPPEALYREHIKDVGGNYEIVPIKTERVKRWIETWEGKGLGFVAEDIGESKFPGYTNVRSYYGSSTYTTEEMGRLLDLIIADCEENGIVTLTPEEIAKLGK